MKRRLSLLLCAVMLTLSACGTQPAPQPEAVRPPAGEEEPTLIQLGHSGTFQSGGRPNDPFMGGMPQGMMPPNGFDPKDMPQFPGGMDFPEMGERPGDMEPPEGMGFPGGGERPQPADGMEPPEGFAPGGGAGSFGPGGGQTDPKDREGLFTITDGANYFGGVGEFAS